DGVPDQIDTDGNDTLNAFAAGTTGYYVNALRSLRIFDPDHDQTGIRITASNRFVAAYGQDTEVAEAAGAALDLGYEIMPQDERFLDTVLGVNLVADRSSVPPSGGAVVFTLHLSATEGPITRVNAQHVLRAGWSYVAGSTLIEFADTSIS